MRKTFFGILILIHLESSASTSVCEFLFPVSNQKSFSTLDFYTDSAAQLDEIRSLTVAAFPVLLSEASVGAPLVDASSGKISAKDFPAFHQLAEIASREARSASAEKAARASLQTPAYESISNPHIKTAIKNWIARVSWLEPADGVLLESRLALMSPNTSETTWSQMATVLEKYSSPYVDFLMYARMRPKDPSYAFAVLANLVNKPVRTFSRTETFQETAFLNKIKFKKPNNRALAFHWLRTLELDSYDKYIEVMRYARGLAEDHAKLQTLEDKLIDDFQNGSDRSLAISMIANNFLKSEFWGTGSLQQHLFNRGLTHAVERQVIRIWADRESKWQEYAGQLYKKGITDYSRRVNQVFGPYLAKETLMYFLIRYHAMTYEEGFALSESYSKLLEKMCGWSPKNPRWNKLTQRLNEPVTLSSDFDLAQDIVSETNGF